MSISGRSILSSIVNQPFTMSSKSYFDAFKSVMRHAAATSSPFIITGATLTCLFFARALLWFHSRNRKSRKSGAEVPSALRRRRRNSVSEINPVRDTRPVLEHRTLIQVLRDVASFIRYVVWDSCMCCFLSWALNIIAVIFAIIVSFASTLLSFRRKKLKVCVATTLASSQQLQLEHAEATEFNRGRALQSVSPYSPAFMVPSALSCTRTRKSLVLDLDETLVHSQFKLTEHCDLRLEVRVDEFPAVFYVSKRPYLDVFLRTVAQWYDVVIFTASLQKYGDPLITVLDTDRVVKRRIFRQDCIKRNGNFVKDLTIVNPNLADVLIVDNSPSAYSSQPSNAVPIEAWYHDQSDEELLNLLPLLHAVASLNDVRSLLDLRLTGGMLAGRNRGRNPVR